MEAASAAPGERTDAALPAVPYGSAGGAVGAGTTTNSFTPTPDVLLKISASANLDDDAKRTSLFKLLDELAVAVDAGDVTHVQLSMSVVVPERKADTLAARANAAGAVSSKTPLG